MPTTAIPGWDSTLRIAPNIEQQGRIVNLPELSGIVRVVERDDLHSGSTGFPQLFLGQFERLARSQRLRRDRQQASRFEFGERCTENCSYVAEVFYQMTHAGWLQARSQTKGKPLQNLFCCRSIRYKSLSTRSASRFGLHARKKRVKEATHRALLESNILL